MQVHCYRTILQFINLQRSQLRYWDQWMIDVVIIIFKNWVGRKNWCDYVTNIALNFAIYSALQLIKKNLGRSVFTKCKTVYDSLQLTCTWQILCNEIFTMCPGYLWQNAIGLYKSTIFFISGWISPAGAVDYSSNLYYCSPPRGLWPDP